VFRRAAMVADPFMQRLWRILSLTLLVLWLPATEHCALEAAGVITPECHVDGKASGQSCRTDTCGVLESAHYRGSLNHAQVVPPVVQDSLPLICLAIATAAKSAAQMSETPAPDKPRDWVPVWHFVRRAAPPSRAPTPCCA
jgi:hypothetical protein